MKMKRYSQVLVAFLLSFSMVITTACSSQWLNVALADLPVLTQMALNIASLAVTLQSGKQSDAAEQAAIQKISVEASQDLNLLNTLYGEYKASPSQGKLEEIRKVIGDVDQNLPGLLQAAHIKDAVLAARIGAGVNLIMTTVSSFAAMIPAAQGQAAMKTARAAAIPTAGELKKQWNLQVCAAGSASASGCELR